MSTVRLADEREYKRKKPIQGLENSAERRHHPTGFFQTLCHQLIVNACAFRHPLFWKFKRFVYRGLSARLKSVLNNP